MKKILRCKKTDSEISKKEDNFASPQLRISHYTTFAGEEESFLVEGSQDPPERQRSRISSKRFLKKCELRNKPRNQPPKAVFQKQKAKVLNEQESEKISQESQQDENSYTSQFDPDDESQPQSVSFHQKNNWRRKKKKKNKIPKCSKNILKMMKRLIIKYISKNSCNLSFDQIQELKNQNPSLHSINKLYNEQKIQSVLKEMFVSRFLKRQIVFADMKSEQLKKAYIKRVNLFEKGFFRGHIPRIQSD